MFMMAFLLCLLAQVQPPPAMQLSGVVQGPLVITTAYQTVRGPAIITGSPTDGLVFRAAFGTAEDLIVAYNTGDGIKSYAGVTTIRRCVVIANRANGIEPGPWLSVVEDCYIANNGSIAGQHHGIYVNGLGHKIRGNTIYGGAGWGIHGYPNISASLVENNIIIGNPGAQILMANRNGYYALPNIVQNNTALGGALGIAIWGPATLLPQRVAGNRVTTTQTSEGAYVIWDGNGPNVATRPGN